MVLCDIDLLEMWSSVACMERAAWRYLFELRSIV